MANVMRWRFGDTNPRMMPPALEPRVEIGDLLVWYHNSVMPFDELAATGDDAETLAYLVANFAGVAMQASEPGEVTHIRVATTGVFEFPCPEETILVGTCIAPCWKVDGGMAEAQRVVPLAAMELAIGRCAMHSRAAGKVCVDLLLKDRPAEPVADGAA